MRRDPRRRIVIGDVLEGGPAARVVGGRPVVHLQGEGGIVEPSVNLNGEDLGAEPPPGASADGALAALGDATAWLNSPPLAASDLRGRVVLVDFWTYTCINWLRSQPYLRF